MWHGACQYFHKVFNVHMCSLYTGLVHSSSGERPWVLAGAWWPSYVWDSGQWMDNLHFDFKTKYFVNLKSTGQVLLSSVKILLKHREISIVKSTVSLLILLYSCVHCFVYCGLLWNITSCNSRKLYVKISRKITKLLFK